jgi:hypothetical protein
MIDSFLAWYRNYLAQKSPHYTILKFDESANQRTQQHDQQMATIINRQHQHDP